MSKIFIALSILLLLVVFALALSFWFAPRSHNAKMGAELVVGERRYRVEVVRDMAGQARGLSGRTSLASGAGMPFVFNEASTRAFWMSGMLFSLDIIWIRDGRVVGFVRDAPPPQGGLPQTFYSNEPADMVLELVAGSVQKDGIAIGDAVELIQ